MKNFRYCFSTLAMMMVMVAGCSSNDNEDQTTSQDPMTSNEIRAQEEAVETHKDMPTDLISGSEKIVTSLNELQAIVERSPHDKKQIQTAGKSLAENWDLIERQVEAQYLKDYVNIEKSLYPLIYETKKEQQNVETIKQHIKDTSKKITEFNKKVAASTKH